MWITYTDPKTGIIYKLSLWAAHLQKEGEVGLPTRFGAFNPRELQANRYALPENPLSHLYPDITIRHYVLVVPEEWMVSKGSAKGVAFFEDNRGSGPCVSVRSEFGVSNLTPISWEHDEQHPNSPMDPLTKPYLEFRTLIEDGKVVHWSNGRGHGFSGHTGQLRHLDWLDGRPKNVRWMYDLERGTTYQSIVTPKELSLGTAQQQRGNEGWSDTIATIVYFPKPEYVQAARKIAGLDRLYTEEEARRRFSQARREVTNFGTREYPGGTFRSKGPRSTLKSAVVESDWEITHSDVEIKQPIIGPYLPMSWLQEEPSVAIFCWLVSQEHENALFPRERPARESHRKGFGW